MESAHYNEYVVMIAPCVCVRVCMYCPIGSFTACPRFVCFPSVHAIEHDGVSRNDRIYHLMMMLYQEDLNGEFASTEGLFRVMEEMRNDVRWLGCAVALVTSPM